MFYRDHGPNVRRVVRNATAAILGVLILAGCGSGDDRSDFGVHFPLPTCEKGNDSPVTFPPLATGQSLRIGEGVVGQDSLKNGAVITPTGNGEFDIDEQNDGDTVVFRPELGLAQFQSDGTAYDVSSRFVEGRTAFTIRPVCTTERN